MAVWAYACHPCRGESENTIWYVDMLDVDQLSPDVAIVRVKIGPDWRCAMLDRGQRVEVERILTRRFTVTDASNCLECEDLEGLR